MGFRINTNIEALNAQRNLSMTSLAFSKSVERLSSGLRINRAGDDAAGLAISEKLRAQVRGTNQAIRNAQDGISLIQTAEGALNEVHAILQRMRELAVQGANDTLSTDDRSAIGTELTQLASELNAIAARTNFNGVQLLDGTGSATFNLQIGANTGTGDSLTIDLSAFDVQAATLGVNTAAVTDATTAQATIDAVDTAITTVNTHRANLGAYQNRLEHTIANQGVASENLAASESRIRDADMAAEMVAFTKVQILQQAGAAVLAQANQAPNVVLTLLR